MGNSQPSAPPAQSAPEEYICAISQTLMKDPVTLVYDRKVDLFCVNLTSILYIYVFRELYSPRNMKKKLIFFLDSTIFLYIYILLYIYKISFFFD